MDPWPSTSAKSIKKLCETQRVNCKHAANRSLSMSVGRRQLQKKKSSASVGPRSLQAHQQLSFLQGTNEKTNEHIKKIDI